VPLIAADAVAGSLVEGGDPAKCYRLRVSVAGSELGWADLDVVAKLRELTGVDWGTDVGVVRELPLPIRFRIEQGAVVSVDISEAIL
jgi:hypothetical protein